MGNIRDIPMYSAWCPRFLNKSKPVFENMRFFLCRIIFVCLIVYFNISVVTLSELSNKIEIYSLYNIELNKYNLSGFETKISTQKYASLYPVTEKW